MSRPSGVRGTRARRAESRSSAYLGATGPLVDGMLGLVVLASLSMAASGLANPAAPGSQAGPDSSTVSGTEIPVGHRELVCPDFSTSDDTVVDVATESTAGGTVSAGVGRLQDLPTAPGVHQVTEEAGDGVRIVADGTPAADLLAVRHDSSSTTSASIECVEPQSQWWFAGGGSSAAHRSFLLLRNMDPGDSTLQLRVFTPDGEADPLIDSQVVVPGNSRLRIDLVLLASFQKELTVSVVAQRGLVAAAMHDSLGAQDSSPEGISWLSGSAAPARTLVFGGDFGGDRTDQLVVTNTGTQVASLSVEVASGNGWFALKSVPAVSVGSGHVTTIDLSGLLDSGVHAVRVVSTGPVVGVLRRSTSSDISESAPLPLLGSAAGAVVPEGRTARLVLLGGPQGGTVVVSSSGSGGKTLQSSKVTLAPGQAVLLSLAQGSRRVDLQPQQGGVYAGVTIRDPGLDTLALRPVLSVLEQPVVVPVSQ